ncbi:DUF397 domain-containing protein [Natronoglycomyces albus]|uniref:DUF397 domain-containing protein n=1 Tax=Natronoglycomyces albus TaxID=2811108 RepID=A0A895XT41_9ACTN|nr:DUF397 domain-containing protein [Natronoglycomyces albus]QSB05706.1 DUF397 domain-containing protein [Natronoglycomyces albus]
MTQWRKSSRSTGGGNCLETRWRKSSRSGGTNSNCVESRLAAGAFQVRDSKLGDASPVFDVPSQDFTGLLRAAQRLRHSSPAATLNSYDDLAVFTIGEGRFAVWRGKRGSVPTVARVRPSRRETRHWLGREAIRRSRWPNIEPPGAAGSPTHSQIVINVYLLDPSEHLYQA